MVIPTSTQSQKSDFSKIGMGYGYYRCMGFWYEIPANQLGGLKVVWVFKGYGLSQVWVRTGSTVHSFKGPKCRLGL